MPFGNLLLPTNWLMCMQALGQRSRWLCDRRGSRGHGARGTMFVTLLDSVLVELRTQLARSLFYLLGIRTCFTAGGAHLCRNTWLWLIWWVLSFNFNRYFSHIPLGDGHHITQPPEDGDGAYRCMKVIRKAEEQKHEPEIYVVTIRLKGCRQFLHLAFTLS